MDLFPYQQRVDALLRAGKNVILQAPTGAGKTRAALFPFLDGWRNRPEDFPRQALYVVPMRVLANQFEVEHQHLARTKLHEKGIDLKVAIQTGSRPEDRTFERDLIFLTIDQVLSSFLNIPYSLSNRQANINAGAIVGSYLVFDEFHLFPTDEHGNGAMVTTLAMLKMLRHTTPFVLMTATFSEHMIDALCKELNAEKVVVPPAELVAMPSQHNKQRRFAYRDRVLTANEVLDDLARHQHRRVIVIANTVDRVLQLAADLRADPRGEYTDIQVLHSRMYSGTRAEIEKRIIATFGEHGPTSAVRPTILIATQVIEVGLNITSDALHTEVAPAAALIQRAGRCARFRGEAGDVIIYSVPTNETTGAPDYSPYIDGKPDAKRTSEREGQWAVCDRTHTMLRERLSEVGQVKTYHDELEFVNHAHTPYDRQLIDLIQTTYQSLRDTIGNTIKSSDRTVTRELIRDIDARSVLVQQHDPKTRNLNPFLLQQISLRPGALRRWYLGVQDYANSAQLDWIAAIGTLVDAAEAGDDAPSEPPEQRRRTTMQWELLRPAIDPAAQGRDAKRLYEFAQVVVLNAALVQYNELDGLRLAPGATLAPDAPEAVRKPREEQYGPLQRETYAEHSAGLFRVYVDRHLTRTAYVRARMERMLAVPEGTLDRAVRVMFAAHDLGKLTRAWQDWAHAWQAQVARVRPESATAAPASEMLAHTDFDQADARDRAAEQSFKRQYAQLRRPPHAAESALAAADLLLKAAAENESLLVALQSAIISHHSPTLRSAHGPWQPVPLHAKAAFRDAIRAVGITELGSLVTACIPWSTGFVAGERLSEALIRHDRDRELVLYLFLVRVLRLCDQQSQER